MKETIDRVDSSEPKNTTLGDLLRVILDRYALFSDGMFVYVNERSKQPSMTDTRGFMLNVGDLRPSPRPGSNQKLWKAPLVISAGNITAPLRRGQMTLQSQNAEFTTMLEHGLPVADIQAFAIATAEQQRAAILDQLNKTQHEIRQLNSKTDSRFAELAQEARMYEEDLSKLTSLIEKQQSTNTARFEVEDNSRTPRLVLTIQE